MRVAMLDIDGTMIHGSLGLRLIDRLHEEGLGAPKVQDRVNAIISRHKQGELSYPHMVEAATEAYTAAIAGLHVSTVAEVAACLWKQIAHELFPFVAPMVELLRRRSLRPVIISSSPTVIVGQLAAALEIDDFTGSLFAVKNEVYAGHCEHMPGRPGGKFEALRRVIGNGIDLAGSFAIGNAQSDACVLERVGVPLVFEPTPELRALALDAGWTISDRHQIIDTLNTLLG